MANLCKSRLKWIIVLLGFFPPLVFASSDASHADPIAPVILWVTAIFFFGVLGRYIARQLNQPGVLGELLMGVLVGNLCYFLGMPLAVVLREGSAIFSIISDVLMGGSVTQAVNTVIQNPYYAQPVIAALSGPNGMDLLKVSYVVDGLSRYGVIFLLFMVGLETSFDELKHTGRESLQVATIGVVAPILLGLLAAYFLMPDSSFQADLFVGATLSATSIGITASVLKEMKKLRTREAKTILGAAMIDDILGLIILAIVSSIVIRGTIDVLTVSRVVVLAGVFIAGALMMGPWVLRKTVVFFHLLDLWEAKLITAFLFLMCLAWLATLAQLASIIGAFVAGMILHDGFFDGRSDTPHKNEPSIQDLVAPLEGILAPLFFMLIGIQVKLETFMNLHVLLIAAGLIVAAVLGKLLCGLGASRKDDRILIGIGMLPRGEVGLVFASIGRTLGVISDDLFAAIILMVIVTTFIAPILLKQRYAMHDASKKRLT
ncbi:MAG TPA: cation:proton antiporter [Legionella sp.]|nr:cation:proton antiporter [Legionella sp.]